MVFRSNSKSRLYVLRVIAVAVLGFLLFAGGSLLYHLTRASTYRAPISYADAIEYYHYYNTAASQKKMVLTFDDGPDPVYTEKIADILDKYQVSATFFFIGEHILLYPSITRDIHARGYEIGNHSFSHSFSIDSSPRRLGLELSSTDYLIEQLTGEVPRYYRPPYLLDVGVDPTVNPYIQSPDSVFWPLAVGYIPVGADVDSFDWKTQSTAQILANVQSDVAKGGHIILLHDDKSTAASLEEIIVSLQKQGYTFTTLDDVLIPPKQVVLTAAIHPGDTDAATGGQVSQLQWFLYAEGYLDPYALSGVFDRQTQEALASFQSSDSGSSLAKGATAVPGVLDAYTRARIARMPLASQSEDTLPPLTFSQQLEQFFLWMFGGLLVAVPYVLLLALALIIFRFAVLFFLLAYTAVSKKTARAHGTFSGPVSVIIPAWNEMENIEATLTSVINNQDVQKEIIVVDDGSTDLTALVVGKVVAQNPHEHIELISIKNGGKARALSVGIERASYDIVVTMDGDTIFARETIRALTRHFDDPMVGAVAGKVYTANRRTIFDRMQALEYLIGQNIDKHFLSSVNAVGVIPGPVGAWRKNILRAAGGFSTDTLVEDQDMTLAVLSRGYRVVYEPSAVAYTETPQHLSEFMKQRFRWVFGSVQCLWKYKSAIVSKQLTGLGAFVLPNIFLYSVVLPLTYPIIDLTLLWGIVTGSFGSLFFATILFTVLDTAYAYLAVRREKKKKFRLLADIPLTRLFYRQLIYYVVLKSLIRAFEGQGVRWHAVKKSGEAQKLFIASFAASSN